MKIGALFPQLECGNDPSFVRDFAQTASEAGFSFVSAYEHVLGANPEKPEDWESPATFKSSFLEPFLLFSYMASAAPNLGFLTRVLVLPQRQTALVAKQAATLDIFCHGRLRLGVAIGWNPVEYTSLNQDYRTRARRIEEQVAVLRELWTNPLVEFHGLWDSIPDAGINPLPIQRPIPIWFGGHSENTLRRVARMGDGWLPNDLPFERTKSAIDRLRGYLRQVGRDPLTIGIEPRMQYGDANPDKWNRMLLDWQEVGATHLSLDTMGCNFKTPGAHLNALRKFSEAVGLNERS